MCTAIWDWRSMGLCYEIADTAKLGGQQLWSLEFSRVKLPEALRKP